MEKLKKRTVQLWLASCMMCLLLSATSCSSDDSWRYDYFLNDVNISSSIPDSLKAEINEMSYNEFIIKNPLKREIKKFHTEILQEKYTGDTIWEHLISLKEQELEPIRAKYQNKTEILRIKRIWLNGDLLPWTYNSWVSISYRFNGSYRGSGTRTSHHGSFSGSVTPDMDGRAKYIGETKLDYINVVFSDNSYERFQIKDNPEWLLAKEGEKVERHYVINGYHVGTDVGRVLEKDAYDLVVGINYVPLFK